MQVSCSRHRGVTAEASKKGGPPKRAALGPPTVFKELQVGVSVMEELNVIVGGRVGVLLLLPVPRDNRVSVDSFTVCSHECRRGAA